jgi:hypothetical protein
VGVFVLEHAAVDGGAHGRGNLFIGGPDVAQEDGLAGGVLAEGIGGQVDIHGAGQRIGHDQGRRGQIVGLDAQCSLVSRFHGTACHGSAPHNRHIGPVHPVHEAGLQRNGSLVVDPVRSSDRLRLMWTKLN